MPAGVYKDLEKRAAYVKDYYKKYNKKTVICECGTEIKKISLTHHKTTKKHNLLLELIHLKKEKEQEQNKD